MSNKSVGAIATMGIDTARIHSVSLSRSTRRDRSGRSGQQPDRNAARGNAAVPDRNGPVSAYITSAATWKFSVTVRDRCCTTYVQRIANVRRIAKIEKHSVQARNKTQNSLRPASN